MAQTRKAILILHRKIDGESKCVCGSQMKYVMGSGWVCRRQFRTNESNSIDVGFKLIEGVDLGKKGNKSCKVSGINIDGTLYLISVKLWEEVE